MNSLNSVERKIVNNYHSFTVINFFLSEQKALQFANGKSTLIRTSYTSHALDNLSFVEFSEFNEIIQIGKNLINIDLVNITTTIIQCEVTYVGLLNGMGM